MKMIENIRFFLAVRKTIRLLERFEKRSLQKARNYQDLQRDLYHDAERNVIGEGISIMTESERKLIDELRNWAWMSGEARPFHIRGSAGIESARSMRMRLQKVEDILDRLDRIESTLGIRKDADAKDKDDSTPLHLAAFMGQKNVAEMLIAKGADVNAKTKDGRIPLHWANFMGQKDMAELLIAKGADMNAKTDRGETPLHIAKKGGRKDIADLLIKHGAKE